MVIKYVHMLGNEDKDLKEYDIINVPANIIEIINKNPSFSKSTIFGQKGLGEPDEIEILSITSDDGQDRTFTYFNKGIHYMMFGNSNNQPIFQVFAYFMGLK